MRGVIANFLQSKGYGFIDGEDRNSYFFHIKEIRNLNETLTPGLPVEFEESLTSKGFKARNIKLSSHDLKYEIPDSVLTSKGSEIKGWQIIERGSQTINISGDSPDEARQGVIETAQSRQATGVVNLEYYKTTGGSIFSNYRYTVHNFRGTPVSLARKSIHGKYHLEEIPLIKNKQASSFTQLDIVLFAIGTISIVFVLFLMAQCSR